MCVRNFIKSVQLLEEVCSISIFWPTMLPFCKLHLIKWYNHLTVKKNLAVNIFNIIISIKDNKTWSSILYTTCFWQDVNLQDPLCFLNLTVDPQILILIIWFSCHVATFVDKIIKTTLQITPNNIGWIRNKGRTFL